MGNIRITKDQSNTIYVMKAIAIFSVICAHSHSTPYTDSLNIFSSNLLALFGLGGVSLFFTISGFFFQSFSGTFYELIKKKIGAIIIPWIVTGSAVYLYTSLRKHSFNVLGWIKNLLGSGSYLWFLSVLLVLYLLFFALGRYKCFLIVAPVISVCSFFFNERLYKYIYSWGGDYLNVINWLFFFWIGYIIGKYNLFDKLTLINKKLSFLFMVGYAVLFIIVLFTNIDMNYRTPLYIIYALFFILFSTALSYWLCKIRIIQQIGRHSFSIYLLHMPFVGLVVNLGNNYIGTWYCLLFYPIVALVLTECSINLYLVLFKLFPEKVYSKMKMIIGLR